jgi:hypothetical protein
MVHDPIRGMFDTFDELQRLRMRVESLRRESESLRSRVMEHELLLIERKISHAADELLLRMGGQCAAN